MLRNCRLNAFSVMVRVSKGLFANRESMVEAIVEERPGIGDAEDIQAYRALPEPPAVRQNAWMEKSIIVWSKVGESTRATWGGR